MFPAKIPRKRDNILKDIGSVLIIIKFIYFHNNLHALLMFYIFTTHICYIGIFGFTLYSKYFPSSSFRISAIIELQYGQKSSFHVNTSNICSLSWPIPWPQVIRQFVKVRSFLLPCRSCEWNSDIQAQVGRKTYNISWSSWRLWSTHWRCLCPPSSTLCWCACVQSTTACMSTSWINWSHPMQVSLTMKIQHGHDCFHLILGDADALWLLGMKCQLWDLSYQSGHWWFVFEENHVGILHILGRYLLLIL